MVITWLGVTQLFLISSKSLCFAGAGSSSGKEGIAEMIMKSLKPEEIKHIITQMTEDALGHIKVS